MSVQTIEIHNLPSQFTPFIGRESEIAEIIGLLQDERCRLLTLLGAGGMGKTRLAIESIQQLTADDFEHGVFYVPLAPLTSADNIVTTVIGVLGIMIGDETPQKELVKFLTGRNLLLVMDNFEHVLDGADLVADILQHAPNVKILATSRESLNLRLERIWHVRGMRFPDATEIDNLEQYSALKLFIDRATWVRHEFDVESQLNCAIHICQLVDGMPLGIELAASWLKTLSCKEIIKEIERGIDFLTTRARDIPERHRSIRAVFDYSWQLLTTDEQAVFPRLSVFRGGFTREAAATVANADLMTLSGLVEKSMVRRDETGHYDVHELLRQYADEKLKAVGEVDDTLSAHTAYFSGFMAECAIDIKGRDPIEGLKRIDSDLDNIGDAWLHAVEQIDYEAAATMAESLQVYFEMRGKYQQSVRWLEHAIQTYDAFGNETKINRAINIIRIHYIAAVQLQLRESTMMPLPAEWVEYLNRCTNYASKNGSPGDHATCLYILARNQVYQLSLNHKGNEHAERALDYLRQAQSLLSEHSMYNYIHSRIHFLIVDVYSRSGTPLSKEAQNAVQVATQFAEKAGDIVTQIDLLYRQFHVETQQQRFAEADRARHKALQLARESGIHKHTGFLLAEQTFSNLFAGDFAAVRYNLVELRHIAFDINHVWLHGVILTVEGFMEAVLGNHVAGQTLGQEAIEKTAWEYDHPSERTLSIAAVGLQDYVEVRNRVKEALVKIVGTSDHHSSFRFDVSAWLAIASALLAHDEYPELAVEAFGFVQAQAPEISGWVAHWQLLHNHLDILCNNMGEADYQALLNLGATRSISDIVTIFYNHFTESKNHLVTQPLAEPLTERELEVLVLIAEGLTNPQIAEKLYLSTGTVKVHTRNIYGKLGVSNRTEAATKARDLNLI